MKRLGHFAFRWRRAIIGGSVLLAVAASILSAGIFDAVKPFGFEDPDSESARGSERYEQATGVEAVPGIVAIVKDASPQRTREIAARMGELPMVSRVATGLDPALPSGVSSDGRSTLVAGFLAAGVDDHGAVGARAQEALRDEPGIQLGGSAVAQDQLDRRSESDLRRAELIALPILFVLSLWVFRGLVAALFPIVVGGLAIVTALAMLRGLAEVVDIDIFAINLVTALGLGLAIDYCLFVVSRYREELEAHAPGWKPIVTTMRTAGRTVAFSSLTIAGALAALLVFPQRFLYSMGIGGPLVALLAGVIALTLVPAMLSVLGPRINSLAPAALQRRERDAGGWYRLAQFVMRRPLPIATATAVAMVIFALPFLRVELTLADARSLPTETSAHAVDAALRTDFDTDPGASTVVLLDGATSDDTRSDATIARLRADPAVAGIGEPVVLDGGFRRIDLGLAADPSSDAAVQVVEKVRQRDWGSPALVFGRSAELLDQRESIGRHLPISLAIIAAFTLALLFAMTRSIVIPLQALLVNVLTVGVALGVIVFVFQDGRLEELLGYASVGAIDRSVPILLVAMVFGLSTDYGIFLISRIQEARREGASDREAIALGIGRSGRLLTAAALLLSIAIGAVASSSLIFNKELAIGAAVGILIDATVMRALLFPALMGLGGRWTWWAPTWLRRQEES